ncbi:unnamed protein product [Caenorhabditis bovis]|uniref:Uncharacterized protein n=1 Tax=Caenorhabditis bovis TaxID=2654633 RepID=A0A8S1F8N6_9PELO|nr:unnamed protein product [Caenorhabditis bovis]
MFREPRKFVETILQYDRRRSILSIHLVTIRSENTLQIRSPNEFMHMEIEVRRKNAKTSMRHKGQKQAARRDDCEKLNELFRFPRFPESALVDATCRISCILSCPNNNLPNSIFEGSIPLKELLAVRNVKLFKFIELSNIELYSIKEEEDECEQYDWIINV